MRPRAAFGSTTCFTSSFSDIARSRWATHPAACAGDTPVAIVAGTARTARETPPTPFSLGGQRLETYTVTAVSTRGLIEVQGPHQKFKGYFETVRKFPLRRTRQELACVSRRRRPRPSSGRRTGCRRRRSRRPSVCPYHSSCRLNIRRSVARAPANPFAVHEGRSLGLPRSVRRRVLPALEGLSVRGTRRPKLRS